LRAMERAQFRASNPYRRGRPLQPYPNDLPAIPPFPTWLTTEVERAVVAGSIVLDMVKESSKLPSSKAHGMHLRVRSAEGDKITCDSSVAATFLQPERGTENAMQPTMIFVEYIGWIEEILELNYGGHCMIVLLCSWVKAISEGRNAIVRRDDYGFTLAKVPKGEITIGPDSFSFPINMQQVFLLMKRATRIGKSFAA
jgi:hypothetical protein